jgi:hypothetical protein
MRNVSDQAVQKIKTHILGSVTIFRNLAIYEIKWKNFAERDTPQTTIRRTRVEFWITKTTDTHTEYVIRIASPLQQWLYERVSMLCYRYTGRIVIPNALKGYSRHRDRPRATCVTERRCQFMTPTDTASVADK